MSTRRWKRPIAPYRTNIARSSLASQPVLHCLPCEILVNKPPSFSLSSPLRAQFWQFHPEISTVSNRNRLRISCTLPSSESSTSPSSSSSLREPDFAGSTSSGWGPPYLQLNKQGPILRFDLAGIGVRTSVVSNEVERFFSSSYDFSFEWCCDWS